MFTEKDCTDENIHSVNLEGRYIILKPEYFKEEFRDEKYQLVKAIGGFGCDPKKMGNAIIVKELLPDGECYRINRCDNDIIGFASDACIAKYKETYL